MSDTDPLSALHTGFLGLAAVPYTLRRPRKFEDILTLDKVFGENLKGPLKISVKGKARQVILRFRKAFTVGCYFRERRKTALT